jgi:hypothetical protein
MGLRWPPVDVMSDNEQHQVVSNRTTPHPVTGLFWTVAVPSNIDAQEAGLVISLFVSLAYPIAATAECPAQ